MLQALVQHRTGPRLHERLRTSWAVESCGGPGSLVVTTDHVASAYVLLNGELLLAPSDFNAHGATISVDVELVEGDNVLEVELRGKPGSTMAIELVGAE